MSPKQLSLIEPDEFLLLIDLPQNVRRINWQHEGINETRDAIQRFLNNQPRARQYRLPEGELMTTMSRQRIPLPHPVPRAFMQASLAAKRAARRGMGSL